MTSTPPAPALTGHTDPAPCPRVEVLISPMPAGVAFISIYRFVGTAAGVLVRGASMQPVSGDFLVIDYEAPIGESITYQAIAYDSSGTPSANSTSSSALTLNSTLAWLQDPLDPTSAVGVALNRYGGSPYFSAGTLASATYGQTVAINPILGSPLPLAVGDVVQAASGIPFVITSLTDDGSADNLRDLFTAAFPLCVRMPASVPTLPGLIYLALTSLTEAPNLNTGRTIFSFAGQSVAGPGLNVVLSPRTWDTVSGEGATWNDIAALYSTWVNVQRG